MDGWNTSLSYWGPAYFQGRLLRVSCIYFPGARGFNRGKERSENSRCLRWFRVDPTYGRFQKYWYPKMDGL